MLGTKTDMQPAQMTIKNKIYERRATMECFFDVGKKSGKLELDDVSVSMQIHQLFRVLWSGQWAVVTPVALLEALWNFVPKFRNHEQQDAQEFLW
jgi:hypothetical protein